MIPIHSVPVFDLMLKSSFLTMEAQAVITLRVLGLAGLWPVRSDESRRMVTEKGPAWLKAATEANGALFSGARPDEIMLAAIAPLNKTAKRNRKRLMRRAV